MSRVGRVRLASRMLSLALLATACTCLPEGARADDGITVDRRLVVARRRAEERIEARIGFRPQLVSARTLESADGTWFFAMIGGDQVFRVACSELALEPLAQCSARARDDFDVEALIVVPPGEARAPFVIVLVFEDDEVERGILENVALIEADGDAAREIAFVTEGLEGETQSLFVVDDDGRDLLDEDIELTTCEVSYEESGDDMDCDFAFASIVDEDGDGLAEIHVITGAESDFAITALVDASLQVLHPDDYPDDRDDEDEDEDPRGDDALDALDEVERRVFVYDAEARVYVDEGLR